jgi:putative membrane protein
MLDDASLARVAAAIAKAEETTRAELVVALAPWAGTYPESHLLVGGLAGLGTLVALLVAPWFTLLPTGAAAIVLIVAGAGYGASVLAPGLQRMFTSTARQAYQVDRSAKVAFVEEGVTATRERTGVLLFVAAFERRAQVLPDLGVQGKLEDAVWGSLALELEQMLAKDDLEAALVQGVERCAAILAEHYPPREDDRDEVPNQVRMRLG